MMDFNTWQVAAEIPENLIIGACSDKTTVSEWPFTLEKNGHSKNINMCLKNQTPTRFKPASFLFVLLISLKNPSRYKELYGARLSDSSKQIMALECCAATV